MGEKDVADMIRDCFRKFVPMSLHDTALDLYKTYLIVGGMPRAVSEYATTHDFDFLLSVQKA